MDVFERIDNQPDAVAFISYVLRQSPVELHSRDVEIAMDLSRKFDVSVRDLLEYRRERLRQVGCLIDDATIETIERARRSPRDDDQSAS